ncbi:MAG: hypothetical protein OEY99_03540 [Aigarchaeota archaeon]|nr:hypothetical protein [Aigarchaeota archaeon]
MPTLEECKKMVADVADEKGWGRDPNIKFLYAVTEIGEAVNLWKHRAEAGDFQVSGIPKIMEEIIDSVYYMLHAAYCIDPKTNLDEIFLEKHAVIMRRQREYVDDRTSERR